MRYDIDLARAILLDLEEHDEPRDYAFTIPEYSREQVWYHTRLLAEAKLIEASDQGSQGQTIPTWIPERLTYAGHEFLGNARNETIWAKAKALIIDKGGSVAFGMLPEILMDIARKHFLP